MTTTRPGTAEEATALRCSECDEPIAECELCDKPGLSPGDLLRLHHTGAEPDDGAAAHARRVKMPVPHAAGGRPKAVVGTGGASRMISRGAAPTSSSSSRRHRASTTYAHR